MRWSVRFSGCQVGHASNISDYAKKKSIDGALRGNMRQTAESLKYIVFTALSYWAMGVLASFFAIPPGFASPIWPAAGLAFTLVLRGGPTVAFGVALGSFAINVGIAGGSLLQPSGVWFPAAGIALGAAAQTLFARWCVMTFTQYPDVVQRPNDAIMLGVLGGPVACLVSSGAGVLTLFLNGVIPAAQVSANWLHWWVGDSIGVLIFAPVILASRFNLEWRKRKAVTTFFIVYLLSIAVATALFVVARQTQENKIEQLFSEKVAGLHASLLKQLQNIVNTSSALSSVFATFENADYDHFSSYAANVFSFTKGTHALSWVPLATHDQRSQLEAKFSREMAMDFVFTERNPQGELVAAGTRPRYFPVTYIYPTQGNRAAIGFDLGSQASRLAAIQKVLNSKQAVVTAPITLVQETEQQKAFLIIAPVLNTKKNVISLVSSVYRIEELLNSTFSEIPATSVAIRITDVTQPENPQIFFDQKVQNYNLKQEIRIPFLQRVWKIEFSPSVEYVRAHQSLNVWVVLICGFAVVTIFGLFLLLTMSRGLLVEKQVQEKTRELNEALIVAEKANSVKSAFLASMSHELRTPLNSIIGFSVRLKKTYAHLQDDKLTNALDVVERNGKHLLNLINDILDLSKVEAGKMSISYTWLNLPDLLANLKESLTPLAEAKKLQLRVGDACVENIYADPKRLQQVIINLVSNAIKYTTEGEVTITTTPQQRNNLEGIAISVCDTGAGIKPEDLDRVFHRYEQLENPFHAGEMGTGLGLALAEELVGLHDGVLSVTSEYGRGSCFTCWLPLPEIK